MLRVYCRLATESGVERNKACTKVDDIDDVTLGQQVRSVHT